MTSDELKAIGELLYGKRWQTPMARGLKVDRTNIWRWTKSPESIPFATGQLLKVWAEKKSSDQTFSPPGAASPSDHQEE